MAQNVQQKQGSTSVTAVTRPSLGCRTGARSRDDGPGPYSKSPEPLPAHVDGPTGECPSLGRKQTIRFPAPTSRQRTGNFRAIDARKLPLPGPGLNTPAWRN